MQNLNTEDEWQIIANKIQKISEDVIHHFKTSRQYKSRQNLLHEYTYVYDQCTSKPAQTETMFNSYKEILLDHLLKSAYHQGEYNLIKQFNLLWAGYITFAKILASNQDIQDRYFLPSRQFGTLLNVAVSIFDKHIFGQAVKKQIYIDQIVKIIGQMRRNMIITGNYLLQFTKELQKINNGLYISIKKIYIEQTRLFYAFKFNEIKTLDPLYFYPRIINLFYFEESVKNLCFYRGKDQIDNESLIILILFSKEIIQPYTDILIAHKKGLLWALKEEKLELLNLIVQVYSRFVGFSAVKKEYYDYINEESKALLLNVQSMKQDSEVIEKIYSFLCKHNSLLTNGFKKNQQLQVTLSNALETVIGKWQRLPEILFGYCKSRVLSGQFKSNISVIQLVFQKVGSKDQFIHKCQQWIYGIILSEKVEIHHQYEFVEFIHELYGAQNTLKLSKLLNDYVEENKEVSKGVVCCKVISHHLWQHRLKDQLAVCINLPQKLEIFWKDYEQIYSLKNSKKKLRLLPISSKLALQFQYNFKSYLKIKCNLLQACVIFSLFERPKSIQELMLQLNIQKHLLITFFQTAKFILSKQEIYDINWQLEGPAEIDFTLQAEDNSKFIKAIQQDRNILLEARIVRVVKRNKTLSFEQIYAHLCQTIKIFRPQPAMVKTAIEKLIKRDFIEQEEHGLYIYKQ